MERKEKRRERRERRERRRRGVFIKDQTSAGQAMTTARERNRRIKTIGKDEI